ncbi:MAG TPA: hypothetical protein VF658_03295 [Pyrinomonadaceae bacterium]|jgi:hypothetical protein
MAAKLSVIFFIVLCLEVGLFLTIVPWYPLFHMNDWGDNYLLLYAARKTGLMGLQHAVASGWVRGAVSGLGVLNLFMAFWEMAHFDQTVRYLQGESARHAAKKDAAQPAQSADELSHHERRDDGEQHPGQ